MKEKGGAGICHGLGMRGKRSKKKGKPKKTKHNVSKREDKILQCAVVKQMMSEKCGEETLRASWKILQLPNPMVA